MISRVSSCTPARWRMPAENQGLPDELHGLFVGPRPAMGFHEGVLGLNPVRFGVDDGAVHVP